LLLVGAIAGACGTTGAEECAPGDYRYCDCAVGRTGYSQCSADGAGYGTCDCSGAIPKGAGVLVEAGAADAHDSSTPSGAFLTSCTHDSDCASNLCFGFNAYGPHCSQHCAKDGDCPAPSPGCSNMKVCKLH
jgi:hypothetical protein